MSLKSSPSKQNGFREDYSNKVLSVYSEFDPTSGKTFQQLIEDAFIQIICSDIDNSFFSIYSDLNSR